jgi:ligand-binding sensor domain-containing protein/DNA-binding CsgD family transcriptional regulator
MKKLVILLCWPFQLFCQNTIGFPDVVNYTKESYGAGLQNWDINQDENGIIYIANNEGLLSFDGRYWNLYPLPNKTIVRSIAIGKGNRIYTGGQDEMGYFAPDANGRLQYNSLTGLIPEKDRSFGDVWDIVLQQEDVFFRSSGKIFKLTNNNIAVFYPHSEWSYMALCNGLLYAHDYKTGLMYFENNTWLPLAFPSPLSQTDPVTALLPLKKDSILISTLKNGLYVLSGNSISKLPTINNSLFISKRIYAATTINNNRIALATNNAGVFITDARGQIIQSFSKNEQLQNNNILSIFLDKQGNLWLGLDNGIDFIAYNSAIKQVSPQNQDGSGYTAIVKDNLLYIGTSNGLYSVPLQPAEDMSFSIGSFSPVNNTTGQVWGLANINNQLLLGHHEGVFRVNQNNALPILQGKGFWNFVPLTATFPSSKIIAGNYQGLTYFNYNGQQFSAAESVPGFNESSRFVVIDAEDNTWVSQPYRGVYKLTLRADNVFDIKLYTEKKGLPSTLDNHVYKIKNQVVVATEKGVYQYNKQKDIFEPASFYTNILGNQSIRYLKEDGSGNIWFVHEKNLGVVDMTGQEPRVIYLSELNKKMLSGFELVYPVNERNIFVSGEKGFFHINFEKYKKNMPALNVQIRTVKITRNADSLLYGGYASDLLKDSSNREIPSIGHNWKTIHFEFSASLFGYLSNLEYSFRLRGFDDQWSAWAKRTEKEYTNLPDGKYSFEVKVRNNLGNESAAAVYTFEVRPPWYQSRWAYLLYILLIGALVYGIYKWQKKKFLLQQTKHEEEQKKLSYIHELEIGKTENELVALRNEKLEAEIGFKNSELASSAMHLVKKGELLSKIKGELSQVMKSQDNPQAGSEMKRLIKALDEDDNIDKEWENFARHFDKVHHDFLTTLKEKHPNLSGNELKLCAHLRMNLSSKEIAQLMNISVRGVEISRYRLRKKLGIASEVNLFDYLMGVQG